MNRQTAYNLIAVLVVVLILSLLMTGCAGKGLQVEYTDQTGKMVSIDTDYQVEQGFVMERDGDGYRIELGSATTKDAEFGVIAEMMRLMQQMMLMQPMPPISNGDTQ